MRNEANGEHAIAAHSRLDLAHGMLSRIDGELVVTEPQTARSKRFRWRSEGCAAALSAR